MILKLDPINISSLPADVTLGFVSPLLWRNTAGEGDFSTWFPCAYYSPMAPIAFSAHQQISVAPPWWHSSEFHQPPRQLPWEFSVNSTRGLYLASSLGSPYDFPRNLTGDTAGSFWWVLLVPQPAPSKFRNIPVYSVPVPFLESLPGTPVGGFLLSFSRTQGPTSQLVPSSGPQKAGSCNFWCPTRQFPHYQPGPMAHK